VLSLSKHSFSWIELPFDRLRAVLEQA